MGNLSSMLYNSMHSKAVLVWTLEFWEPVKDLQYPGNEKMIGGLMAGGY